MDMLATATKMELKTEAILQELAGEMGMRGTAVESMAKTSMLEDKRLVELEALTRAFVEGI